MRIRPPQNLRFSARDVDPLTWFTGPYIPLVMAALVLIYGGAAATLTWSTSPHRMLQFAAVGVFVLGCLLVQVMSQFPGRHDWRIGSVAVGSGTLGIVLAAHAYPVGLAVDLWWAPSCLALLMAALTPYLAAWRILLYGNVMMVIAAPLSLAIIGPHVSKWGVFSTLLLLATPVAVQTAATTAFAATIVRNLLPMVDNRSSAVVSEHLEPSPEDEEAERVMLARSTARAVPFLRGIAERGTVGPPDRALAGELARYLRDDLVSRSDLAWLGLPAGDTRVVVVDPGRRVERMRSAQRAAIRDLVRVVLDDPATDAETVLIELRADPSDGATAVAITLDARMPEGRRVRHLAPYYFNLRGEVKDIRLRRDGLWFRVPSEDTR